MSIQQSIFGKLPDGTEIQSYTMTNQNGLITSVMTYGAALISMRTPDKNGTIAEITLGHDTLDEYVKARNFFGVTVGRFANRIAKGQFELDGKPIQIAQNSANDHHLHGGDQGFDVKVWGADTAETETDQRVIFTLSSPDGEEGYPGNLEVTTTYILTNEDELIIDYKAKTDRTTIVNLTNHAYWNLTGQGSTLDHQLQLFCSHYLPVDKTLIPTGEIASVKDTPMDFREIKSVKQDIADTQGGYDHCFVVDRTSEGLAPAGILSDPVSGRYMEIQTTKPGIQFYTGNFLENIHGRNGMIYQKHHGLCLETEYYPDAVNHPGFPSPLLRPGETYHHITAHRFYV